MTGQPTPTSVLHFTRVEHLESIVNCGLLSDVGARAAGSTEVEIGHPDIKRLRRERKVPRPPHGTVGDYVPFYFAPRSPMLYVIHRNTVPGYSGGCDRIVYLVTTLEALLLTDSAVLVSDRNAVKPYASFHDGAESIGDVIDWELMQQTIWKDTPEHSDRKERRMAEVLVRDVVPWSAFGGVAARSELIAQEARRAISSAGALTPVSVRPNWYF